MTTPVPPPAFPDRNGFARFADLSNPDLQRHLEAYRTEAPPRPCADTPNWSRRWEYPYVLANLDADGSGKTVLDAGCGLSAFTLRLARQGYRVLACDLSPAVGRRLTRIATQRGLAVAFSVEDLRQTRYPSDSLDAIGCVSVLEHAGVHRDAVLAEFHRILKPGGRLLLTFDVSIDGRRDLALPHVRDTLKGLADRFEHVHAFGDEDLLEARVLSTSEDVLRTTWFRAHAPEQLPWRRLSRAGLHGALRGRFGRPFFDLAVMGFTLRKA